MASGTTTQPITAELIDRRVAAFEHMLKATRARGQRKQVDAFRAGMRQMLTDLVAMEVVEYVTLDPQDR
jgi:hypothetical protein